MVGITEKIASAKTTKWISDGISETDIKTTVDLAKISAKIERCRIDMEMTQKEFAKYMDVTQAMVSKWESREYNFTIRSLNEICQKIDLTMFLSMDRKCSRTDYTVINWDEEIFTKKSKKNSWIKNLKNKEAIA